MTELGLAGGIGLVGVGLYGLLVSRNLIKLLIALQLAGKGALLALVAGGQQGGQPALGESLALSVIVADTVTVTLGIGLAVALKRRLGTLDLQRLSAPES